MPQVRLGISGHSTASKYYTESQCSTFTSFKQVDPSLVVESSQKHITELLPEVMSVLGVGHTAQRQSPQSAVASNVVMLCINEKLPLQVKNQRQNSVHRYFIHLTL